jgi:uncharacterized SAM-binding protein YcdF (DUF218 family)
MAKKKTKRIAIAALLLLFLQFGLFYRFWLSQIGAVLIAQDRLSPADAILVLGGGRPERVVQGVELYRQKYADRMIFTGEYDRTLVNQNLHWASEAQKLAARLGVPKEKTILIFNSRSTHDDATLSREVCRTNGFRSLIVVSEPYHTRRARFTFHKVYKDTGIKIMIYPVQDSWYRADTWWHSESGLLDTNSEYVKFVYYLLKGYLL